MEANMTISPTWRWNLPGNLAAAEKAAEKSFVLLKNNGILPLDKGKI